MVTIVGPSRPVFLCDDPKIKTVRINRHDLPKSDSSTYEFLPTAPDGDLEFIPWAAGDLSVLPKAAGDCLLDDLAESCI